MRKIITTTFVTLDGVMQAPGGSEEDTADGFKYGGWQFGQDYDDEVTNKLMQDFFTMPFEMLLGKRTYDIFAGYWPKHPEVELVATPFNATRKYVVSDVPMEASWNNSTVITGDAVAEIRKLKTMDAPDLWVWGSGELIQTLLKEHLVDRMYVWTYPVTIGSGKKLFEDGTQPDQFKMVDAKVSKTGVIVAAYEPAGPLKTGTAPS